MRKQPIEATAWEVEAARRREVIEADFGVAQEPRADRGSRSERGTDPIRRLASWIAALARADGGTAANRVDHGPGCRPRVGVIEPGS